MNKKAVHPVVAIALLLVVTVVSVVAFQQWFIGFSSNLFAEADSRGNFDSLDIKNVIKGTMYVYSDGTLSINTIKIGNDVCYSGTLDLVEGLNEISVGNCLSNLTQTIQEFVLVSDDRILSETFNIDLNVLDCSSLSGGSWIYVPGSTYFGLDDFCVMKYEGDAYSGIANSSASSQPSSWINFTESLNNCSALGTGYHLITNREWMTIARQIETNSFNWNSSQIGSGFVFKGHTDDSPSSRLNASLNDNDGYYSTGNSSSVGPNQRRTHYLSNGEVIWDFAGNLEEWVDANETGDILNGDICGNSIIYSFYGNDGNSECPYQYPYNKTNTINKKFEIGPLGNYNANNGIGRIEGDTNPILTYMTRGGSYLYGIDNSGIYTVDMQLSSFGGDSRSGFRCVYSN